MARFLKFLQDERGAETVQFVVWFPLWFVLIVIITDVSLLYYSHSEMSTVARDAARRLTTGKLCEADAPTYVLGQLGNQSYSVNIEYDTASTMGVAISVPVSEVIVFGFAIKSFVPRHLATRVAMRSEPNIVCSGGGKKV